MENTVGVRHQDNGEVTLSEYNSSGAFQGKKYQGYQDYFEAKIGLVIRNLKAIIRIANIETSGVNNLLDPEKIIDAMVYWLKGPGSRLYCNQVVEAQFWKKVTNKNNVNLTIDNSYDEPVLRFNMIPIRPVDEQILLNTETAIS